MTIRWFAVLVGKDSEAFGSLLYDTREPREESVLSVIQSVVGGAFEVALRADTGAVTTVRGLEPLRSAVLAGEVHPAPAELDIPPERIKEDLGRFLTPELFTALFDVMCQVRPPAGESGRLAWALRDGQHFAPTSVGPQRVPLVPVTIARPPGDMQPAHADAPASLPAASAGHPMSRLVCHGRPAWARTCHAFGMKNGMYGHRAARTWKRRPSHAHVVGGVVR